MTGERARTSISRLYTLTGGQNSPAGQRVVSMAPRKVQSFGSLLGNFFREKVSVIGGASLNIIAPRLPKTPRWRAYCSDLMVCLASSPSAPDTVIGLATVGCTKFR